MRNLMRHVGLAVVIGSVVGQMLCGCGGNVVSGDPRPDAPAPNPNPSEYLPDCQSDCERSATSYNDTPQLIVAVESSVPVPDSFAVRFEGAGNYVECFKQACGGTRLPLVPGCYCAYHSWSSNRLVVFWDEVPVASKVINAPLPEELDLCPRRTVVVRVRIGSPGDYDISDPEMVYSCQARQPDDRVPSDGGIEGGASAPD